MKVKRLISLVLAILLCVGMCGCSGSDDNKKIYKIGVLVSNIDDDFMAKYAQEVMDYFEEKNTGDVEYDLTVLSSDNNVSKQITQVETFANQQYDALIVSLINSDEALSVAKNAVAYFETGEGFSQGDDGTTAQDNNGEISGDDDVLENENVDAEPNPRVDDVYVPVTEGHLMGVVFTFTEPQLTQEKSEEVEGEKAEGEQIDTSMCCSVSVDANEGAKLLAQAMGNLPRKGDISGDGEVNYVVIANDKNNNTYNKCCVAIDEYFKENNITGSCLGTLFTEASGESLEKNLHNFVDNYAASVDVIFCFNNETVNTLYLLTNEGKVFDEGDTDGDEQSVDANKENKYYDIGYDFYVVGLVSPDEADIFLKEGKLSAAVSFNCVDVAHKAVDAVINYLKNDENEKLVYVDVYKMIETKENE